MLIRLTGKTTVEAIAHTDLIPKEGTFFLVGKHYPDYTIEHTLWQRQVYDYDEAEFLIGWRCDNIRNPNDKAVYYWDDIILWPTIDALVQDATRLPEWQWVMLDDEPLVNEVMAKTLKLGTINGTVVNAEQIHALAKIMMLQIGPAAKRASAITQWNKLQEGEQSGTSWLFQPPATTALSYIATQRRQDRVAFGNVKIINGNWVFTSVPKALRGDLAAALIEAGHAVVMHDKGNYGSVAFASLQNGYMVIPAADMTKPSKALARMQLLSAGQAAVPNPQESYLLIDGQPATVGKRFRVAAGTTVATTFSGAAATRPGYSVLCKERRTITAQLPKNTPINVQLGQRLSQGDSVVGIEGIAPYKYKYDGFVTGIRVDDNKDGVSDTIHVHLELLIRTYSPKIRGSVKASCHPVQSPIFDDLNIDIVFGTEVIKSQITLLHLFADTTKTTVNIVDGLISEEAQAAFHQWVAENTRKYTWTAPVAYELIPFLEDAGFIVTQDDEGSFWVTEQFDLLVGEMVAEIETPVTELRATRAAPTMLQWLTLAAKYGHSSPAKQALYGYDNLPKLSMKDTAEAMTKPWTEALAFLAELYPRGATIGNGHAFVKAHSQGRQASFEATTIVDFTAMLNYTSGELHGDDAMSIALYQCLHHKLELNDAIAAFLQDDAYYPMMRDASEKLGNSLSFLRNAIAGFALGGQLLRDMVRPARRSTLLTARAYHHVPVNEVWVSPETAQDFNLVEQMVQVSRFPGIDKLPAKLVIVSSPLVTYGVAITNSLAMQVGNAGDVDGDQVLITPHHLIPDLYNQNYHKRDAAIRFLCMMLANQGYAFEPKTGKAHPKPVKVANPNFNTEWQSALQNYLRHTGVSKSAMVGFFNPKSIQTFLWQNGVSGRINLDELRPEPDIHAMSAFVDFGTKGVGQAYAMMFNTNILHMVLGLKATYSATKVAASIYEDVALAGYKPEMWPLHKRLSNVTITPNYSRARLIASWHTHLAASGFNVTQQDAIVLMMSRAIQAGFNSDQYDDALIGSTTDWRNYIPVCKAFRAMSSGQPSNVLNVGDWTAVQRYIPLKSPLGAIYKTIYDAMTLFTTAIGAQEQAVEDELSY